MVRQPVHCTVISGAKLLAGAGGPQRLCTAVEGALAGTSATDVAITVAANSRFEVDVATRGGKLPTMNFMEADRSPDAKTIDRLAAAIAKHVEARTSR